MFHTKNILIWLPEESVEKSFGFAFVSAFGRIIRWQRRVGLCDDQRYILVPELMTFIISVHCKRAFPDTQWKFNYFFSVLFFRTHYLKPEIKSKYHLPFCKVRSLSSLLVKYPGKCCYKYESPHFTVRACKKT